MSIPVTCPECHVHFHVDDEFAGRPGRCPECAAILRVPDLPVDDHHEDHEPHHAYGTPHFDPLPRPIPESRRPDRVEAVRRPPELARVRGPRFDPHARAARWLTVSRGLRNVMVAVVLLAVNLMVIAAFVLVDEIKPGPPRNFVGRNVALTFGTAVAAAIGVASWMAGRIGCARVPYVPARRVAVPAGIVAGLSGGCAVISFVLAAAGILMIQQGNLGGSAFVGLGVCGLMPASVGVAIGELLGLSSQVPMATGLTDGGFGRLSRFLFAGTLLGGLLSLCGGCGLFMFLAAADQKAQQQAAQQQQQEQLPPPPPGAEAGPVPREVPGAKNPPAVKDAKKDGGPPAGNGGPGGPAAKPPAPPPDPTAGHPEVLYGMAVLGMILVLVYAGLTVACLQVGRRAIRREIARLVGDPHDHAHDGHH